MRWNDRAAKRKGRHGTDTTGQASRPPAETTDRKPPPPSASDGWRETPRGKQAQGERGRQQEIETENDSQPQSPVSPPIVSRNGARDETNRPDRRDDKRGERRDGPMGKQDIATHPARRDENTVPPQPSRQANRPRRRRRESGIDRLSTSAQTA